MDRDHFLDHHLLERHPRHLCRSAELPVCKIIAKINPVKADFFQQTIETLYMFDNVVQYQDMEHVTSSKSKV